MDDYSNTPATTGVLSLGGAVSGILEQIDDADWFKITLVAGRVYTFQIDGYATGGGTFAYPHLQLYSGDGTPLTVGPPGGSIFTPFTSSWKPTDSGIFYISVAAQYPIGNGGTYTLSGGEEQPLGQDDHQGSRTTSSSVTPHTDPIVVDATIERDGDQDWFYMSLTAGIPYYFQLDGMSLYDPVLSIRDSSGSILFEVDNDGVYDVLDSRLFLHRRQRAHIFWSPPQLPH